MLLSEWPLPDLRFSCKKCGLTQSYNAQGMVEILGDMELWQARMELHSHCEDDVTLGGCQVILTDALLVDAMLEQNPEKITDKDLLAKAEAKKAELGLSR